VIKIEVSLDASNEGIRVKMRYHEKIKNRIRRELSGRWKAKMRSWYVPYAYYSDLKNLLLEYNCKVNESSRLATHLQNIGLLCSDMDGDLELAENFKGRLYDFQKKGHQFLMNRTAGMLAYETGLGKTVVTISVIQKRIEEGKGYNNLIICPNNVKLQWAEEIKRFTGNDAYVIDSKLKNRDWFNLQQWRIANYAIVRQDKEKVLQTKFNTLVVDEIHNIGNHKAQITEVINNIDTDFKIGLSATPFMNKPEEYYNVMNFLAGNYLGFITHFRKQFCKGYLNTYGSHAYYDTTGYKNLDLLHKKTKNLFQRVRKLEVEADLPEVVDTTRKLELNTLQNRIYKKLENRAVESYESGSMSGAIETLTVLRMLVDSPELLTASDAEWVRSYVEGIKEFRSAKTEAITDLIYEIIMGTTDEKVFIFTEFVNMAKILSRDLREMDISSVVVTGQVPLLKRKELIDKVKLAGQEGPRIIIATPCLSEGINAQFCSYLIHADLAWTPGAMKQRQGRVHRMGSTTEKVNVYTFITEGTVEERMLALLQEKQGYVDEIIEGREPTKDAKISMKRILGIK